MADRSADKIKRNKKDQTGLIEKYGLAEHIAHPRPVVFRIVERRHIDLFFCGRYEIYWHGRVNALLERHHAAVVAEGDLTEGKVPIRDRHHAVERIGAPDRMMYASL